MAIPRTWNNGNVNCFLHEMCDGIFCFVTGENKTKTTNKARLSMHSNNNETCAL